MQRSFGRNTSRQNSTNRTMYKECNEELVRQFIEKHGLVTKNQALQLEAEVGELCDAILMEDDEMIAEEIGDVEFVLRSIALLEGVDIEIETFHIAKENLEKDESKKGSKVTKT